MVCHVQGCSFVRSQKPSQHIDLVCSALLTPSYHTRRDMALAQAVLDGSTTQTRCHLVPPCSQARVPADRTHLTHIHGILRLLGVRFRCCDKRSHGASPCMATACLQTVCRRRVCSWQTVKLGGNISRHKGCTLLALDGSNLAPTAHRHVQDGLSRLASGPSGACVRTPCA
jgi:hypothetical protein